ncbi:sodium- and chloride-dependent GABA transporter 2-like [Tachypleus tridentatus]
MFSSNIEEMTGHRPNWYFLATWVFVSPAVCLEIFLFSVMSLVYAETYVYPWWGELLGWGIALASMRLIAGLTPKLQPSQKLTKTLVQDFELPRSKNNKLSDSGDYKSTAQDVLHI